MSFDGGRLLVFDEVAHARDAHDAALGRELADGFIGFQARVVIERAAIRMRKCNGLGRNLDGVQCGPVRRCARRR